MTFPATALPITAQAWLGDTLGWVTMPVRAAAGGGGVKIKRDRNGGAALPDPGTCSLVIHDPSGDWNPRNPRGQYLGLIGRNTPIRVSYDGGATFRFCGEAADWSPSWSLSEQDRTVTVQVTGILRRLLASNAGAASAMRRTFTAAGPVAYWPMEDGVSATQVASAITGHPAATIDGSAPFVDVADYSWGTEQYQTVRYGTGKVVELKSGASITATVPGDVTAATRSAWTAAVGVLADYNFTAGEIVLLDVATPGGTFTRWQLIQRETVPSGVLGYELVAYDQAGAATSFGFDSGAYLSFIVLSVTVWQDGATVRAGINAYHGGFSATGSAPGTTAGVASITLNPTRVTSTAESMPFGHLVLYATATPPAALWPSYYDTAEQVVVYGAYLSHWQESATDRLARLCAERGVPLTMPAVPAEHRIAMGWQPPGTFGDLLAACVDVDGGMLVEQRDGIGLLYRPRFTLYNAPPAVSLSYAAGHIAEPFRPRDDDDQVANDVTVERVDGSSARATLDVGELSVQPPPDGIGPYEDPAKLNLAGDDQLPDQAGWRLLLGTVPESRYPQIVVKLDGTAFDDELRAAVAAVDGGDLVELTDLPDWLPPGPVLARVDGYEEEADSYAWQVTFTASPGGPWAMIGYANIRRAGADGTVLQNAITASALSLTITSTAENRRWTTDPADFPLDVFVSLPGAEGTGEKIQLASIAGTGLTQTATVTPTGRARNGVSRSWPAGATVQVVNRAVAPL